MLRRSRICPVEHLQVAITQVIMATSSGAPMRIAAVTHAVPSAVITNRDLVDVMLARSPELSPAQQHVAATLLEERLASCGAVRRFHRRECERAIDFTIAAA